MAEKSTVSISFRVFDDGKGFKTLTADADRLRKIMAENVKVTNNF